MPSELPGCSSLIGMPVMLYIGNDDCCIVCGWHVQEIIVVCIIENYGTHIGMCVCGGNY